MTKQEITKILPTILINQLKEADFAFSRKNGKIKFESESLSIKIEKDITDTAVSDLIIEILKIQSEKILKFLGVTETVEDLFPELKDIYSDKKIKKSEKEKESLTTLKELIRLNQKNINDTFETKKYKYSVFPSFWC